MSAFSRHLRRPFTRHSLTPNSFYVPLFFSADSSPAAFNPFLTPFDIRDKLVNVSINYTPYYWRSRNILVDLLLRVAIAACRDKNSCEVIYGVRVICSREWNYSFVDGDALIFDTFDKYAATVLRRGGELKRVDYDDMFTQLALILIGKYLIVDKYKAFGETLRLGLPS